MSYEGGICTQCCEQFDDGDGKECPACHRVLCYLHYPDRTGAPDPNAVCIRCVNEAAPRGGKG